MILVTGATGMTGQFVVQALQQRNSTPNAGVLALTACTST